MSSPAAQQKIRRIVLTGAFASVTAVGAWYGADLKIQEDTKKEVRKRQEASPAEKIAQLEEQRGALVAKRIGLERKIAELEARRQGKSWEESKVGVERKR